MSELLNEAKSMLPHEFQGATVAVVSAVTRNPEQYNYIRRRLEDASNLFFIEARVQWRNVADEFDVHLLLPSGTHVFFDNQETEGFRWFRGIGWQSVVGTSNEFGEYHVWFTSKHQHARPTVAVIELQAIRPFDLNGLSFNPGPAKFLTLVNGGHEHKPKFTSRLLIDRED